MVFFHVAHPYGVCFLLNGFERVSKGLKGKEMEITILTGSRVRKFRCIISYGSKEVTTQPGIKGSRFLLPRDELQNILVTMGVGGGARGFSVAST